MSKFCSFQQKLMKLSVKPALYLQDAPAATVLLSGDCCLGGQVDACSPNAPVEVTEVSI